MVHSHNDEMQGDNALVSDYLNMKRSVSDLL